MYGNFLQFSVQPHWLQFAHNFWLRLCSDFKSVRTGLQTGTTNNKPGLAIGFRGQRLNTLMLLIKTHKFTPYDTKKLAVCRLRNFLTWLIFI